MNQLDLRIAARERGETMYMVGFPCKRGHISPRYVSTGGCKECLNPKKLPKLTNAQLAFLQPVRFDFAAPAEYTPEVVAQLLVYLQLCVDTFGEQRGVIDRPRLPKR